MTISFHLDLPTSITKSSVVEADFHETAIAHTILLVYGKQGNYPSAASYYPGGEAFAQRLHTTSL
jgi:hypothetical protein